MVKVAIYGQTMPVVCQSKRGCPVVSIDQLRAMGTSNSDTMVEDTATIGDYNPITKKWS
jgi:hypothetical protein